MDKSTGMYPAEWRCRICKVQLNKDGFHPAELYAGTYTGLCYKCEAAPYFVEHTYFDGALRVSYPPSSPSWRRDRETFTAYADCTICQGKGVESTFYNNWTNHRVACKMCSTRYYDNAVRVKTGNTRRKLYIIAESLWERKLTNKVKAALGKGRHKKDVIMAKRKELWDDLELTVIRNKILERHAKALRTCDQWTTTREQRAALTIL